MAFDLTKSTEICTPTVSSTMIDRIIVNTPFFGIFFYYSQWVFLGVFIIGFIIALFRRPRNNVDADLQELVDEEEEGLLRYNQQQQQQQHHHYQTITT